MAGGFLAEKAVAAEVLPRRDFRAKKIFPQRWYAELVHEPPRRQTEIFRKMFENIRLDYDSLIFSPAPELSADFLRRMKAAATQAGFEVFVPAAVPIFLLDSASVFPLKADAESVTVAEAGEGFLVSAEDSPQRGIVLYDRSLCRWSGFLSGGVSEIAGDGENLAVARFLDRAEK